MVMNLHFDPYTNLHLGVYFQLGSKDRVMASLLKDKRTLKYDILAIQEPWKNPFENTTFHPAKDSFHLVYNTRTERTRVCFFVNKRLETSRWSVAEHSADLITLKLQIKGQQEDRIINIHNAYNPPPILDSHEPIGTIPALDRALRSAGEHIDLI